MVCSVISVFCVSCLLNDSFLNRLKIDCWICWWVLLSVLIVFIVCWLRSGWWWVVVNVFVWVRWWLVCWLLYCYF